MMRSTLSKAFPRIGTRIGAVCGLCVVVFLGCGGDPDSPTAGTQDTNRDDSTSVEETLALANAVVEKSNELLDSLRAVQTAQDVDQLRATFPAKIQELGDAYEAFAERVPSLTPEQFAEVNDRRKNPRSALVAQIEMRTEAERIREISGAPRSDFWGEIIRFGVRKQKIDDQYRVDEATHASSRLSKGVAVKCWGPGMRSHAAIREKLREFDRGETRSDTAVVWLAYVEDFDALVAAVKERVGNVEQAHKGMRVIGVWVDPAKIPPKSSAEVAAERKAKADSSVADASSNDGPPGGFGSGPDEPTPSAGAPAPNSSASNPFEPGNAPGGPGPGSDTPAPRSSASNPFAGGGPASGFGSGPPPGFGGPSGPMGIGSPFEPDVPLATQDPDELVEIVKGGDGGRRKAAVRNLAAADPSEASKETKKAVCLALKTVAFDQQADGETRALAVEGMALWAGKYAAPQLVQLLKHSGDGFGFRNREFRGTILRVLGELRHPETLEPLVLGFADGTFEGDAVAECLIQFGPEAEPLILKHCRPGNREHSRRVVYILFKIGTPKSLPALRALSRSSEGFFLREEIAQAADAIQMRRKEQAQE